MMTEEILRLSDLNLAEYTREMTRWNAAGEIFEKDDLLLTLGAHSNRITNVAIDLSYERDDASSIDVFNRIQSFYKEKKALFSIHMRGHVDKALESICKKENMQQISEAPGMIVYRPVSISTETGIDIRTVKDRAGVVDLASIVIQSFQDLGMPDHITKAIFASPERLLRPYNYMVVAYKENNPLSTAMIIFSHGMAGIYWVGTKKEARRGHLAEACVAAVTNEAFRRGALFVVLQASTLGEPLYKKLGFTQITSYPWYMATDKNKAK